MSDLPHILIVDDEPFNIEIITELLDELDEYRISSAKDGAIAIEMMEREPEKIDVVLLDRMMPNMNGMQVLERMKQHEILRNCPVIFQTAKTGTASISEGIKAGAHYYLTKPFDDAVLLSVVKTAVADRIRYKLVLDDLNKNQNLMGLLKNASFEFQTLDDARNLASLLSHAFPDPNVVAMGLTELMINSIEHGNLGITYDEKSALNDIGRWDDEVNMRLLLPKYANKRAQLTVNHLDDRIEVVIRDEGDGFDWHTYMDFDPKRVMDNHGRGIAIANKLSFSEVEYKGKGNEVYARLFTKSLTR